MRSESCKSHPTGFFPGISERQLRSIRELRAVEKREERIERKVVVVLLECVFARIPRERHPARRVNIRKVFFTECLGICTPVGIADIRVC